MVLIISVCTRQRLSDVNGSKAQGTCIAGKQSVQDRIL